MWCSLGCRLQLQVFAADGLKFEHGPRRAWALTSMEAKCLHIESYGGNHSGAMQGTSCHTGFVGEAAAAGAADPKPHRLERQLCSPDKKSTLSKSRTNARFVVTGALPYVQTKQRPCGLMDKALVFGTKDCRFEFCQGHTRF